MWYRNAKGTIHAVCKRHVSFYGREMRTVCGFYVVDHSWRRTNLRVGKCNKCAELVTKKVY